MSPKTYSEDQLVEQPAIGLFADLGWQTVSAMEEVFGATGTLGRETSGEVVLAPQLRAALEKLNPKFPAEAITSAMDELTRDRSAMTLAGANREFCGLLMDGVKVQVPDRERGGLRDERVRVVAIPLDQVHPIPAGKRCGSLGPGISPQAIEFLRNGIRE